MALFVMSHGATRAAAPNDLADLVTATYRRGLAGYLFFGTAFAIGCWIAFKSSRRQDS
jgi:hypothetical protein